MEIKNVLVALDLTPMDEQLIKYTAFLDKLFHFEKIYFFHIAKNLELPEELTSKYPDLLAPLDESLEQDIKEKVSREFSLDDKRIAVNIEEGNAETHIIKWAKVKVVDLILMGRKKYFRGSGLVPSKVARVAGCSVMFVPEEPSTNLRNILVSIDFSTHSELLVEQCIVLAKNSSCKLTFFHVFTVPSGYSKIGKTYGEFGEIMRGHAQNDMNDFLKKVDLTGIKYEVKLQLDNGNGPCDELLNHAHQENSDMIAFGSKGRTNAASFLLGSLAEKMVKLDSDVPLLIVKKKGSNLDFIQALFKI